MYRQKFDVVRFMMNQLAVLKHGIQAIFTFFLMLCLSFFRRQDLKENVEFSMRISNPFLMIRIF